MTGIDKLLSNRNSIYMATALSFCVWQVAELINSFVVNESWLANALQVVAYAGILGWAVCTLFLMRHHARVRSSKQTLVINDEGSQRNFGRAIRTGFLACVTAVCLALAFADQLQLGGTVVARLVLIVCVVVPLVAFVLLERSEVGD